MSGLEIFAANHLFWAYFILFGGMFIEGEVIFLTAALLAWQGYLKWLLIIFFTFAGVFLGDIFWYILGRCFDRIPLFHFLFKIRFSVYHEWLDKNFFKRYSWMAFISKFLYYFNRLTPLIAGWQKFRFSSFLKIHFKAALLWTLVMAAVSYLFGLIAGPNNINWLIERFELLIISLIIIFFGGQYWLKRLFSRRIKKELSKISV